MVTINAVGTQTAIAQTILDGGGDYVLALKQNQPGSCAKVEALLPTLPIRSHLRVDTGRATPEAFDCPMFSRVDGIYPIYVGHIKTSVALAALVAGEA